MIDESPTTQLRQSRASNPQIMLDGTAPRHEPLTAARGILLGVFAGAVSFALILAAVRAIWRHFT
jgi:hypothetical protein